MTSFVYYDHMPHRITLIPGDGIGPEVADATVRAEDFAVRHRTGNNDCSGSLSQKLTAGELSRGRIGIYRCGFHQV